MMDRSWIVFEGALCRVGGILNNPKKIRGIGIIIKEANIDFGYGGLSTEWFVLIDGSIKKLHVSMLWPLNFTE